MNTEDHDKWKILTFISVALVCSMTSWFAATAVLGEFSNAIGITLQQGAWLTNAVQIGFVFGALGSAFLSLTDVVSVTRILSAASLLAGISTALLLLEPTLSVALVLRFISGIALAGVYPTVTKLTATWFVQSRGMAIGIMVGALTLGSAMPYFVRTLGNAASWQLVITVAALACVVASAIFGLCLREGPHAFPRGKFNPAQIGKILKDKPVMLANVGYFGHMWELYAMWGWILAYASAASAGGSVTIDAAMLAFLVVAAGAPGCLVGGYLSDRFGRCRTTITMMTISGSCAVLIGFVFNGPTSLFVIIALVWGFTAVADSAQFSTAVSELSQGDFVGSSLAFQMAVGFAITVLAIFLVSVIVDVFGSWRWSFLILLPGPVIGVIAMIKLRAHPDSIKLAGGLR